MAACIAVAPSCGAGTFVNDPLKMVHAVRAALRMYVSRISFRRGEEVESCRRDREAMRGKERMFTGGMITQLEAGG